MFGRRSIRVVVRHKPAATACPDCKTPLSPGEAFCARCGKKFRDTPRERAERIHQRQDQKEKDRLSRKIGSGRMWILIVAILAAVGGVVIYAYGQSALDRDVANVESGLSRMPPEERAAVRKTIEAEAGHPWEEAVRRARSELSLNLTATLVLAAAFFGLYWWAGSNPFPASMIALLLFITLQVIQVAIEPASILRGVLFKLLILGGLVTATSAAHKYRLVYGSPGHQVAAPRGLPRRPAPRPPRPATPPAPGPTA